MTTFDICCLSVLSLFLTALGILCIIRYIQVGYDEHYDGAFIKDMDEYLQEWNDIMNTDYKSMEDFNEGEEWRAIYKINL